MKKFLCTLGLVLSVFGAQAHSTDTRAGSLDHSLDQLQLVLLRESALRLSGLATSRCLDFLSSWQQTMRDAQSEIVLRETFKGRLNSWVGSKVSTRNSSLEGLYSQKEQLQKYGESIAAHASRFHRIMAQCKAAAPSSEIYTSAHELFDAIAEYSLDDATVLRDQEVERLFGQSKQESDLGEYTDRVIASLATVSAMPSLLQRGMPYEPPSILARYGAEIILALGGSLATGFYVALGGEPARKTVVHSAKAVVQGTYGQLHDSARAVYNLFSKPSSAQGSGMATSTVSMIMHPQNHLAKWIDNYYRDFLKPKVDLTKAATITTMLGTMAYKSHASAMSALNSEILGVVNNLSLMLNKYDTALHSELSPSDQGFMLLWTKQLRYYQEIAPEAYRHMLSDMLAALDDEKLNPGQKLSAITISLRRLR